MFGGTLGTAVRQGLRSLARHRLRSALTTLGVILGVASVIVMLAVGEAVRFNALKQLEDLGANTVVLRSVKPTDEPDRKQSEGVMTYGLTPADLRRVRSTIPTVIAATPVREYRRTARRGGRKAEIRIVAATPDFLPNHRVILAAGRGIEARDEAARANVCVLGAKTAEALFPQEDAVGKTVSIEELDGLKTFVTVGVCEPKTLALGGGGAGEADFNLVVCIPFESDRTRFGRELVSYKAGSYQRERLDISQITVEVGDSAAIPATAAALTSLLAQFHPLNDFAVVVPYDLLKKVEETQRLFTLVLGSIAGISLAVGGIGIMNIMLASVTERTREIGVRRALGARKRDIARQFLVETTALSAGGGLLGVALGFGVAAAVARALELPTIVRPWAAILAFTVSLAVGLLAGMLPARRAADLDPIEALRHS